MKLGLKPSLNFKLHFGNYVDLAQIPPIPDDIDWSVGIDFSNTMFGNGPDPANPPAMAEGAGDCFWAAGAKVVMEQSALAGTMTRFDTADVLNAYAECTGFDPLTDANDEGTEPTQGFRYLQNIGLKGNKFGPPLALSPARPDLIMAAQHLGGFVMLGTQFFAGWEHSQTWDIAHADTFVGGHEVPSFKSSKANGLYIWTWGEQTPRLVPWDALARFADQLTVCINPAFFKNGQAPNGLNLDAITADAALLGG